MIVPLEDVPDRLSYQFLCGDRAAKMQDLFIGVILALWPVALPPPKNLLLATVYKSLPEKLSF